MSVITMVPRLKPARADLKLLFFLYNRDKVIIKPALEIKCIIRPTNPLLPKRNACINAVIKRTVIEAGKPNSIVAMTIGMSAISYTKKGATGIIGILTNATSTIDIAAKIASSTRCIVVLFFKSRHPCKNHLNFAPIFSRFLTTFSIILLTCSSFKV